MHRFLQRMTLPHFVEEFVGLAVCAFVLEKSEVLHPLILARMRSVLLPRRYLSLGERVRRPRHRNEILVHEGRPCEDFLVVLHLVGCGGVLGVQAPVRGHLI